MEEWWWLVTNNFETVETLGIRVEYQFVASGLSPQLIYLASRYQESKKRVEC